MTAVAKTVGPLKHYHRCSPTLNDVKHCLAKIKARNRRRGLVLVMALSLCACSTNITRSEPETESTSPLQTLIILGDSIMANSFDGAGTTSSSVITREYDWRVINISQSGETVANAVRLEIWKAVQFVFGGASADSEKKRRKNNVVVQLGHNDWFWWGADETRFEENYRKLLTERHSLPTTVYCIVPISSRWDYNGKVNASNVSYEDIRVVVRDLAEDGLCQLIETLDWYTEQNVMGADAMPDQLHLNGKGHQIFAENLMESLRSNRIKQQ
jgi:lysophospholipase L1-like esterase